MREAVSQWWDRLAIQRKVWVVVLLVIGPMVAVLMLHLAFVRDLLATQDSRHRLLVAREQVKELRRMVSDIESGFRGYLLTNDQSFLAPLNDAEHQVEHLLRRAEPLLADVDEGSRELAAIGARVQELSRSTKALIAQATQGNAHAARDYVQSGEGIQKTSPVMLALRAEEDRLDARLVQLQQHAVAVSTWAFWVLVVAAAVGVLLGLAAIRQLTRSLTRPLETVRASLVQFADAGERTALASLRGIRSSDELGHLARSCEQMIHRIGGDIRELEALHDVGLEIGALQPDGLHSVVQRIADQAATLLGADVCLILSRNETMACWVVEAASGDAAERMRQTVMLWEELPLSVQAYDTGRPVIGEQLRQDARPELQRRNVFGESMLAVPLISQGTPFGVVALLCERPVAAAQWNVRMAESLAGAAAVAIMNARLYDAAYRKEQQTRSRLQQLEQLGETLAHDLKSPAERMAGLVSLLRVEVKGDLSERGHRLLELIAQNGWDLGRRVEEILSLARVGGRQETLEAVDPVSVIDEVLKARAGEIDAGQIRIVREPGLLPVACPRAYVYQVFDNLISNAIKFVRGCSEPTIRIEGRREGGRAWFSVSDNGPGVPPSQRERIFDPFVRLNTAIADGTGIGLAIVRRIVELYGGRVWVDPVHTPGCAIRFTLPLIGNLKEGAGAPVPPYREPHEVAVGAAMPTISGSTRL